MSSFPEVLVVRDLRDSFARGEKRKHEHVTDDQIFTGHALGFYDDTRAHEPPSIFGPNHAQELPSIFGTIHIPDQIIKTQTLTKNQEKYHSRSFELLAQMDARMLQTRPNRPELCEKTEILRKLYQALDDYKNGKISVIPHTVKDFKRVLSDARCAYTLMTSVNN